MRQGALLLTVFLAALIAGCGGASSYTKSLDSSTNTSASAAGSAGTSSPSAGAATGGTSSAPGTSSSSGSSTSGTTSSGSSGSAGGSTGGGSSSGGTATGNPPAAPAPTPTATTQVVISSPADGAAVSSPTQVSAAASGGAAITSMQVYVDDGIAFQAASAQIDASLPLPAGAHTIVLQAWDQNGNAFKSSPVHVNVQTAAAPPAPAPAPSAPAPTIGQIQTQGGWDDCDVCAGDAGNGPHTAHGMQRGISSPSLSGASTRFDIGGTAWGAALFWLELGSHDDAQNLRYDLDFYIDSTSSAQALEFDVNQTANGNKYIFGTECDFRNTGTWRVWNGPAHTWASTGVGCPMPDAGTWHHLTWEFQRSGGQAHFIAVTLDGDRHDVGMAFDGLGQSGSGLDVAFQADLNASGGNVSVWLDNVSLSW